MDNPYQPPQAQADICSSSQLFRPSMGEVLFLLTLVGVSFMTHWWYRPIHDFLHVPATVLGRVVEATVFACWGCTLAVLRYPGSVAQRVFTFLGGVGLAVLAMIGCCWVLFVSGMRPHGLALPISVIPGVAATFVMMRGRKREVA